MADMHSRWGDLRVNGCRAPVYADPKLDRWRCMKCDDTIEMHPMDTDTQCQWYLLLTDDEYTDILEIMRL